MPNEAVSIVPLPALTSIATWSNSKPQVKCMGHVWTGGRSWGTGIGRNGVDPFFNRVGWGGAVNDFLFFNGQGGTQVMGLQKNTDATICFHYSNYACIFHT